MIKKRCLKGKRRSILQHLWIPCIVNRFSNVEELLLIILTMCLDDIGNDLQRSEEEVRYPGKLERCGSRDYLKKNEVSFLLKIPDILHHRDSLREPKGKSQEKQTWVLTTTPMVQRTGLK